VRLVRPPDEALLLRRVPQLRLVVPLAVRELHARASPPVIVASRIDAAVDLEAQMLPIWQPPGQQDVPRGPSVARELHRRVRRRGGAVFAAVFSSAARRPEQPNEPDGQAHRA